MNTSWSIPLPGINGVVTPLRIYKGTSNNQGEVILTIFPLLFLFQSQFRLECFVSITDPFYFESFVCMCMFFSFVGLLLLSS